MRFSYQRLVHYIYHHYLSIIMVAALLTVRVTVTEMLQMSVVNVEVTASTKVRVTVKDK